MLAGRIAAFALTIAQPAAQQLPPMAADLQGTSAVACVKIARSGAVADAFILTSTGDPKKDAEWLQWVRQLHWDAAAPDDHSRDKWVPMGLAAGAPGPAAPSSCAPAS